MDEDDFLESYGMINRSQKHEPLTMEQRLALLEAKVDRRLTLTDRHGSINGDGIWDTTKRMVSRGFVWDLNEEEQLPRRRKRKELPPPQEKKDVVVESNVWTT